MTPDQVKIISKLFKKNCYSCEHLDVDWDDKEYGNGSWYFCNRGDDNSDSRSEKMYDKNGKEAPYLKKAKRCHKFSSSACFNGHICVDIFNVLKVRTK